MRKIIVGADGGGTKTRFAALDVSSGKIVSKSESGSIHWLSLGIKEASRQLKTGVEALGISRDETIAVSLGDPSLDDSDPSDGEVLREAARELCAPGGKSFSKSDVFMALYGLSRGEPAALVVSGTGSMGAALTEPSKDGSGLVTVGGWGEPTGDPGSGFSIAVAGIKAACDAFDGIGEETPLCEEVLKFFGAASPRSLIGVLNSPEADRAFVAAFAPRVEDCALRGDLVSARILDAAGETLAKYAVSLLSRIRTPAPRLGYYGGILLNCRAVREKMTSFVRERFPNAVISRPDHPPEIAAALFAADRMGIKLEIKI
ncbi:MAG: hypothetical protein IJV00_08860 [Clostridia bacterium]|nr:hypothetical protein [Clostridia bacterium]